MRTLLAVLLVATSFVATSLVPTVASAQWSDDRIENLRTERRVARDAAFVGVVAGSIVGLISIPLLIATVLDEPVDSSGYGYRSERARWDERMVGSSIGAGVSLALLTASIIVLAVVPSPGDPVPLRVGIGPGRLSIEGAF